VKVADDHDLQVLRKAQSVRLWQAGAYGNKLSSWSTLHDWRLSEYRGLVTLRSREGAGGGHCIYDVVPGEVLLAVVELHRLGVPDGKIMVNECAPREAVLLQGEYRNDVVELDGEFAVGYFVYSLARGLHMRDALKNSRQVSHGLAADLLLKQHMTPASHEDWNLLIDKYPGHVLEVSVYDRCLGDLPHRNALVWEARKY
jgi:hypothetical protein